MASTATNLRFGADPLCERCGYALNGLPEGGNCPECGDPTERSAPSHRGPADWERPGNPVLSFISTSRAVIFHPTRFYRSLATRMDRRRSIWFANLHWLIVSILFSTAIYLHLTWFMYWTKWRTLRDFMDEPVQGIPIYAALSFCALAILTRIAARLTDLESRYRGYRLPTQVVLRGMDFHAAHYLPVAMVVAATVAGYRLFLHLGLISAAADLQYLYVLCAEVVVGAGYLFWTYWIAMRNMMYANA